MRKSFNSVLLETQQLQKQLLPVFRQTVRLPPNGHLTIRSIITSQIEGRIPDTIWHFSPTMVATVSVRFVIFHLHVFVS